MSETTTIQVDRDLKTILDTMVISKKDTYNDIIKRLIEKSKLASSEEFKTADVDSHGKASISRKVAGRTIEWRVKQ